MDSYASYILALIVLIAAVFVIKKVAGCMIRIVVFLIALAIIAVVLYLHFH